MKPGTDEVFCSPRSAGPRATVSSSAMSSLPSAGSVVGDQVYDHHRDVVLAAALQGRLDERVRRRLGTVRLPEHFLDLLVGDHPAEAVAAEQQPVARLQRHLQKMSG